VAALPGGDALLKRRIGEGTAAPQDTLQRTLLGGCGRQLFLAGLAARSF